MSTPTGPDIGTFSIHTPHPSLRPYIHSFWTFKGEWTQQDTIRLIPDGCITLILNLGETVHGMNHEFILESDQVYLIGMMTSYREHYLAGQMHLCGIQFTPGSFSLFYDYLPQLELAHQVNDFEPDLFPDIKKTRDQKVDYLNQFYLDRLTFSSQSILPVITHITHQGGKTDIDEIMKKHFMTARQLERKFQRQVGVSPKSFINLVRSNHVLQAIRHRKPQTSLMEIAFDYGYYDHAHLTNAIRQLTGMPPTDFILSDFSKIVT